MTALTAKDINAAIVDVGTKNLLIALLASGQIAPASPVAGPAELTDSTGGTVSTTLAAGITDAVAKNAIASLNAQINALLTQLVAAGVLTQV